MSHNYSTYQHQHTVNLWSGSFSNNTITSSKEGLDLPLPDRLVTIRDHTKSNSWCSTASRTHALGVIGGKPNLLRRGTWKRFDVSSSCLIKRRNYWWAWVISWFGRTLLLITDGLLFGTHDFMKNNLLFP